MTEFPLDAYRRRYPNISFVRDRSGVLEMTLHGADGGPLQWCTAIHRDLPRAFQMVAGDRENRAVVLTTTGDVWCVEVEPGSFVLDPGLPPVAMDEQMDESVNLFESLLAIRVPLITAIPGPASVHAELGLVGDVVLAADSAYIQNQHFGRWGIVPGDGVHVVFPALLGPNRGRYHLLTSKPFTAAQALEWGAVTEVTAGAELMNRAREIAREVARKPTLAARYTRATVGLELRRRLQAETAYGLSLEALSSGFGTWAGRQFLEPTTPDDPSLSS